MMGEKDYLERGMARWAKGEFGKAMTDFHKALALNPESRAREALRIARDVMDFRNTDLLNP